MIGDFLALFEHDIFRQALHIVLILSPLWVPIVLAMVAYHQWMAYKQTAWIKEQGSLLLEIRLPNEMLKSPALMEVFLQVLNQTGVGTLVDVYLKGRVRPWFSLELVSNGGQVHFYIWMHAKFKQPVETALYAQFPNIEVHEVPDYALGIQYDPEKYKIGKFAHMVLTKPEAYPIKTYVDYGLDKDPKEEYKNDPIAVVLEFLGSLRPGEHAWIQILLQGHTKEGLKYGRLTLKPDWKAAANEEIKKILKEAKLKGPEEKALDPKFMTDTQKETVKAIERSLEKTAFDTMIRVGYFAETSVFNANNIGGILGTFKQFSSNTLNGFRPSGFDFDYIWQDPFGTKKPESERQFLEAYKRRAFFHGDFKYFHEDKPYVLTTEEIATLYHFPSAMVAATPTLARIPSKKAEAPANLPL
jgi:hypothetical protein